MNKKSKIVLFGLFFLGLISSTCIYDSLSFNYNENKNILTNISNKSATIDISSSFISDGYKSFVYAKK